MFVETIPRLNWKLGRNFSSNLLGGGDGEHDTSRRSTSSLPSARASSTARATRRNFNSLATMPMQSAARIASPLSCGAQVAAEAGGSCDSVAYAARKAADADAGPQRLFFERVLWIKQQFRAYRAHLTQKMNAKASTSAGCEMPQHPVGDRGASFDVSSKQLCRDTANVNGGAAVGHPEPPLQKQRSQKCLSVSQIVRQQSETTHKSRRLTLSRSRALLHDDGVTTRVDERDKSACVGERRPTSCSDAANSEKDRENVGKMSSIMSPNTVLLRPTRLVTVVDQQTNDNYIQLNQYRLMEEIGQAMKVLDKIKLVKNFACFRPPPMRRNKAQPSSVHRDPLQLVQREIAILKKLHHPNVVKLVEVLDDPNDNYLYMVFEYVEHRSLMELPMANPLDEHTAWKYFRDTLKGLEYLHYQKIVHRDIKPSNLLLSDTGQVKIADFGVSCEFEGIDAFLTGTAGTPAFMAPEALSEESSLFYSGRAQDIWSLGITLYALVFGNVPFWDAYVIALHRKIKYDPLSFPETPKISKSLEELLLGMLKKDPGHRLLLQEIKQTDWVTRNGTMPMPSEEDNCHLVTVTEEEIENCVRVIPRLDTLILVKAMGHRKRFGNPFRNAPSHPTTQSLKFRRKSSSVRDPLYTPSSSSTSSIVAAAAVSATPGTSMSVDAQEVSMVPDRAPNDFDDNLASFDDSTPAVLNGHPLRSNLPPLPPARQSSDVEDEALRKRIAAVSVSRDQQSQIKTACNGP